MLDGLRLGFARFPLYSLLFHCRMLGGELRGHPLETRAVGFFGRDNLPWPVAGIERWGELAFAAIDGEISAPATSTRPAPRPGATADVPASGAIADSVRIPPQQSRSTRTESVGGSGRGGGVSSLIVKSGRSSTPIVGESVRGRPTRGRSRRRACSTIAPALAQVPARRDHLAAGRHDVLDHE